MGALNRDSKFDKKLLLIYQEMKRVRRSSVLPFKVTKARVLGKLKKNLTVFYFILIIYITK